MPRPASYKPKRSSPNYKPAPKGNKRAIGNKGGGRRTKLKPELVETAKAGYEAGLTDKQMAAVLHVNEGTIHDWKKVKPEFYQVSNWKEAADGLVERSLFTRALGYETPDTHFSTFEGQVTATPTTKHIPADPASIQFWLRARKRDEWGEKESGNNQLVNLNIVFLPDPAKAVNGIADGIGKQAVIDVESGKLADAADTPSTDRREADKKECFNEAGTPAPAPPPPLSGPPQ